MEKWEPKNVSRFCFDAGALIYYENNMTPDEFKRIVMDARADGVNIPASADEYFKTGKDPMDYNFKCISKEERDLLVKSMDKRNNIKFLNGIPAYIYGTEILAKKRKLEEEQERQAKQEVMNVNKSIAIEEMRAWDKRTVIHGSKKIVSS